MGILSGLGIPNPFAGLFSGGMGVHGPFQPPANPFGALGGALTRPETLQKPDTGGPVAPEPLPDAPTVGNPIEAYIRQSAERNGIDPDVAVRVARSEGGLSDPFRQSDVVKNGKRERSYGPFQLYMDGGLGNKALARGIDPRRDWKAGVDFALENAARSGWGAWYGAAKVGIGNWDGIRPSRDRGQPSEITPARASASVSDPGDPWAVFRDNTGAASTQLPSTRGSGGGGSGGGSSGVGPDLPGTGGSQRNDVPLAFSEWQNQKTTRRLRGLSPGATLKVLAEIGRAVGRTGPGA